MRVKAEINQTENQFRPRINQRSDKIAQVKQNHELQVASVTERLYNDAAERIERNMMKTANRIHDTKHEVSQMSDPHTFHPNVNDISKFLAENNEVFHGDFKNFQSRQEEFIQRQLEKREQLRSQYSQEA